jgi:dethiobiotin synthetase
MEEKGYFVTGIDTDVGKTIVSSILVEMLGFDYWKPMQSGDLDNSDTMKVQNYVSRTDIKFFPERYRLTEPMSPHAAANIDGINVSLSDFKLPSSSNLLVEGAGGLYVPLNNEGDCIVDLASQFGLETIVVSRNYLGSINHTLLTVSELKNRGVSIKGIILVGAENKESQTIIKTISGCRILGVIPMAETLDKKFIVEQAAQLKKTFYE